VAAAFLEIISGWHSDGSPDSSTLMSTEVLSGLESEVWLSQHEFSQEHLKMV